MVATSLQKVNRISGSMKFTVYFNVTDVAKLCQAEGNW